jgi:hypothetical protein
MADTPTVYLGQFTEDNAEAIAARLDDAGIAWWHKTHGRLMRLLSAQDWGTRLFVEQARLDDARHIAEQVAGPLP